MTDLFGQALLDYKHNCNTSELKTWSSIAGKDVMPLKYLFRSYKNMPPIEQKALNLCSGKVLDIGCGAGSHSLYLQKKGYNISSLDISKGAIEVCQLRGLKKTLNQDLWQLKNIKFDTILLLMNGIGLSGTLQKLPYFLNHLKSLLNKGGQILVDSSDIIYMYKTFEGTYDIPSGYYYGEVQFKMTYKKETSQKFNWLYLDFKNLKKYAQQVGLKYQKIQEGSHYDYLAKLSV